MITGEGLEQKFLRLVIKLLSVDQVENLLLENMIGLVYGQIIMGLGLPQFILLNYLRQTSVDGKESKWL